MPFTGKLEKTPRFPFWVWPIYFLLLWQILLWAENPGLMSDDSGEMAAAAFNLGLSHPPGYPLFDLAGHLACQLPLGTAVYRLNLFSGFLVLLSLFFTLDAARQMGNRFSRPGSRRPAWRLEALLAVMGLVFISCRIVFAQSLTAKGCVYTLTLLYASVAAWLYLSDRNSPGRQSYWLLGCFLEGVGLANHWQTQLLWVPFLVLWFFQRDYLWWSRTVLLSLFSFLIGLSLYLYLPLRAQLDCRPSWGYPINLPLFYWVVSRSPFAG